jgi:hypothetical protein
MIRGNNSDISTFPDEIFEARLRSESNQRSYLVGTVFDWSSVRPE